MSGKNTNQKTAENNTCFHDTSDFMFEDGWRGDKKLNEWGGQTVGWQNSWQQAKTAEIIKSGRTLAP